MRSEVFKLLVKHAKNLKFYAAVRDKNTVLAEVRDRNARDSSYRYNQNELYDTMTARLFRDRLHKADAHKVVFARRGTSDRSEALKHALNKAKENLYAKWNIRHDGPIDVQASAPSAHICLQASDYFAWSLQRMYERREDRFLAALWPSVRLVMDIDDTRKAKYEAYFTQTNPLTLSTIKK